jgi:hypothetical protein
MITQEMPESHEYFSAFIIVYVGASSLSDPLSEDTLMINKYSRVLPPCADTSSPAAFADPPV